jgi:phenylpropionate dioxygenase-like ring-hydroxylating dioxygenase large terminal subunit
VERFVRNAWYMAGWASEVTEQGLCREIIGKPIFIYRLTNGNAAAILDRCPHRFAPLSKGERDGDTLICGYHGLRFNAAGQCVYNPFGEKKPAGAEVETFAAIERDNIMWLWGGKKEDANPAMIPDFSFIPNSATLRSVQGYTRMNANYEYGTDNLMDLSHIEFVHKGTFAGQGVIFAGKHEVRQDGDTLHSNWWMPNIAPPMVAQGLVGPDETVDHWLNMRWNAPASMRLDVGACRHDQPTNSGFEVPQAHILTPANDHETHYFWTASRSHDLESDEADAYMLELFGQAFNVEDKPMIEAAYANVKGKDFWKEQPISIGIDQGGTRARRQLEAMMAREMQNG